jgi:hypothetical protein
LLAFSQAAHFNQEALKFLSQLGEAESQLGEAEILKV